MNEIEKKIISVKLDVSEEDALMMDTVIAFCSGNSVSCKVEALKEIVPIILSRNVDKVSNILDGVEKTKNKTKKKRKQSEYNKFIGECIKEERGKKPNTPVSEAMKSCAYKWKEKKV